MLTKIDGLTIKVQIFCSHQLLQSQKKWEFKVDRQIDANKSLEIYINVSHSEEQKEALLKTASFSNARGIFIKCSYSLRSLIAKIKKKVLCVSRSGQVLIQTEASSIFYGFAMSKYEHQVHPMLLFILEKSYPILSLASKHARRQISTPYFKTASHSM